MEKSIIKKALIFSIIIVIIQMIFESVIPNGAGFWATPIFSSALFITTTLSVEFSFAPFIIGFITEVVFLTFFGVMVGIVFKKIRVRSVKVGASAIFCFFLYLIMWFIFFPVFNPVMNSLNPLLFFIFDIVWGVSLGFIFDLNNKEISTEAKEATEVEAIPIVDSSVPAVNPPPVENIDRNDPMALVDEKIKEMNETKPEDRPIVEINNFTEENKTEIPQQ